MEIVKTSTKKGQALLRRALHYEGFYLSDVYGSHSNLKRVAHGNPFELLLN